MSRRIFLILLASAGCGQADNTAELITQYEAILDEIEIATQAYVDEVDVASELSAVPPAQENYMGHMDTELVELEDVLAGFHDCTMQGDSRSRVDLAGATITTMHGLVDALPDEHGSHTELTECEATAAELDGALDGHMRELEGHSGPWGENMMCTAHGGPDGPEPHDP